MSHTVLAAVIQVSYPIISIQAWDCSVMSSDDHANAPRIATPPAMKPFNLDWDAYHCSKQADTEMCVEGKDQTRLRHRRQSL